MNTYAKYYGIFERSFMGCTTVGILVQSIIGAIAAMAVLTHGNSLIQMLQLFIVVASCMVFNGSVLSQQKPKVIFNILFCSAFTCIVLAIVNFAR
ncbi:MAG TPA: hypothetical protein VGB43_05470 [Flavobacterium sp.]